MELLLPITVGLGATAIVCLIGFLLYSAFKPATKDVDYIDQLDEMLSEDEDKVSDEDSIVTKWNRYWGRLLGESEISRYELGEDEMAGREALIALVGVFFLSLLLIRNIFLALLIVAVVWYVVIFYIRTTTYRKTKAIDEQLPGLLFSIKSNLQAGDTNERALMGVVDSMPSPLREELIVGRNILLANGTFKDALEAMRADTTSKDLKFLCACMIQASTSGSSMIMQLDNIQKVLEARREVANEIDVAVKAVSPALWLAGLVIPVMFVVSYFMDTAARGFWFQGTVAWIGFFAVVALYIIGLIMTKNQVDKVRNI